MSQCQTNKDMYCSTRQHGSANFEMNFGIFFTLLNIATVLFSNISHSIHIQAALCTALPHTTKSSSWSCIFSSKGTWSRSLLSRIHFQVTNTENAIDSSTPWCNDLTTLNLQFSAGDRLFPKVAAIRLEINFSKN